MFIVLGMTKPAVGRDSTPVNVTMFEEYQNAWDFISTSFNKLSQDEKDALKGTTIDFDFKDAEGDEQTTKVKIKEEYTIMYVEEL